MRDSNRLKAITVERAKLKPGRYGDGDGLWLQVTHSDTRSWIFRFMRAGRARQMGLGSTRTITLAEARERARQCRKALLDGLDPIDARLAAKLEARAQSAKLVTFRECAERYIAAHTPSWRNEKHAAQWPATLEKYVYEALGGLPVHAIDTGLVMKVLEPIWPIKPDTAGRVRGRIETVLDWATARGFRQGENPARWRGHLDKLLPPRRRLAPVKHHAAMSYDKLPQFMAELRENPSISARALEFTILTAVRSNETYGARWSEIDLQARVWTIPGVRMKGGRDHRLPLSERAVEILRALSQTEKFVFPGAGGAQLSSMAMLELLRGMTDSQITVHGFRSSFRDWAAERTNYSREVAEAALAHAVGDKVEAAYRRGDLFKKRRRLMAAWAGYCMSTPAATSEKLLRLVHSGEQSISAI